MFGIKKLLFRDQPATQLADDVRTGLEQWRDSATPGFDEVHFHSRYVVVDIATRGRQAGSDELQSISATVVRRGAIRPAESCFVDFTGELDADTVNRQLLAFLLFLGKAPLATYHVAYVEPFLQRVMRERLGVDFQSQWIDLAWLLPSMFDEKSHTPLPLDRWLEIFALEAGDGRRDPMENALLIARLLQMLLVRATGKEVDTAAKLIAESQAASFLRRTH